MDCLHYVLGAQPCLCAPDPHNVMQAEAPGCVYRQAKWSGPCVASPRAKRAGDERGIWLWASMPACLLRCSVALHCAWGMSATCEVVTRFQKVVAFTGHCFGRHVKHLRHRKCVVLQRLCYELTLKVRVCSHDFIESLLRCLA